MKALTVIKLIFSIIGALMLSGAIYLMMNTFDFLDKATLTTGEVIELVERWSDESVTYAPIVSYLAENNKVYEYQSSSSSYPAAYEIGEVVEIFYLPENPHKAEINGFFSLWGGATIVGGLGSIFFGIGFAIIFVSFRLRRNAAYLIEHGNKIEAQLESVSRNMNIAVNDRHPYKIICKWLDPGTDIQHTFESKNIWFDPSDHINKDTITVYIDPMKPAKYFVDISFLPKRG